MRASATDPLIVPAAQTTANSFLLTFHLLNNPKTKAKPKMEINRDTTQTRIYKAMKATEKTYVEK